MKKNRVLIFLFFLLSFYQNSFGQFGNWGSNIFGNSNPFTGYTPPIYTPHLYPSFTTTNCNCKAGVIIDVNGTIAQIDVNWGDNTTSTMNQSTNGAFTFTHCYSVLANYSATVTVSYKNGTTDTTNYSVDLNPCPTLNDLNISIDNSDYSNIPSCTAVNFSQYAYCNYVLKSGLPACKQNGILYSWSLSQIDQFYNPIGYYCNSPNNYLPNLRFTTEINQPTRYFYGRLGIYSPSCGTSFSKGFLLTVDAACGVSLSFPFFFSQEPDKDNSNFYLKTSKPEFSKNFLNPIIAPNPVKDILNVSSLDESLLYELYLFNTAGGLIRKTTIQNGAAKIDVSDLNAGLYFSVIKNGQEIISTDKILKE